MSAPGSSYSKAQLNLHAAVKVHAVDTNCRVVLDSQIDMFANTKPKVACLRKVPLLQLIFLHLETALKNFFGFRTSDCDMDSNLLVTTNTESPDCVSGLAYNRKCSVGCSNQKGLVDLVS